jgi:hypothetical protein
MEEFAIGANLESAAARRNERERLDALAEFKNFGRQTDGLRRVVSDDAVFDRYLGFHLELLSKDESIGAIKRGQDTVEAACRLLFFGRRLTQAPLQLTRLPITGGSGRFRPFGCAAGTEHHRENDEHLHSR